MTREPRGMAGNGGSGSEGVMGEVTVKAVSSKLIFINI